MSPAVLGMPPKLLKTQPNMGSTRAYGALPNGPRAVRPCFAAACPLRRLVPEGAGHPGRGSCFSAGGTPANQSPALNTCLHATLRSWGGHTSFREGVKMPKVSERGFREPIGQAIWVGRAPSRPGWRRLPPLSAQLIRAGTASLRRARRSRAQKAGATLAPHRRAPDPAARPGSRARRYHTENKKGR